MSRERGRLLHGSRRFLDSAWCNICNSMQRLGDGMGNRHVETSAHVAYYIRKASRPSPTVGCKVDRADIYRSSVSTAHVSSDTLPISRAVPASFGVRMLATSSQRRAFQSATTLVDKHGAIGCGDLSLESFRYRRCSAIEHDVGFPFSGIKAKRPAF